MLLQLYRTVIVDSPRKIWHVCCCSIEGRNFIRALDRSVVCVLLQRSRKELLGSGKGITARGNCCVAGGRYMHEDLMNWGEGGGGGHWGWMET